jgi:hypothetical protein
MSAESNLTKAVEDFDFTEVKQKEDNVEVLTGSPDERQQKWRKVVVVGNWRKSKCVADLKRALGRKSRKRRNHKSLLLQADEKAAPVGHLISQAAVPGESYGSESEARLKKVRWKCCRVEA